MPRYVKNTVILAKVENPIGTDATPTGSADAILVSDFSITPYDANNIDRGLVRGSFGASEQLVGTGSVKLSFTVDFAGSGTAGTAPQWGKLLTACAVTETTGLTTPTRVEYGLTSSYSTMKALSIYFYDDGVLHKAFGSMGNAKFTFKAGEKPKIAFDFVGAYAAVTAANPSNVSYTNWKTPVAMTKANVVDITLGVTLGTGAVSGGTAYATTGIEFDLGNSVNFTPTLSTELVDITDRNVTGKIMFDLTAAQEVALTTGVIANTTSNLAMTIGTATGNKAIIYKPNVQFVNPSKGELNGRRMVEYDLRIIPSSAGNDELKIIML
jgi:hypothetical protein